jgi:hypothetical protein
MDNNITYGKNWDILWIRLYKQHERKIRFESHPTFLQDCLLRKWFQKGFNLKWTLSLGSNGGGDNNINKKTAAELREESIKKKA